MGRLLDIARETKVNRVRNKREKRIKPPGADPFYAYSAFYAAEDTRNHPEAAAEVVETQPAPGCDFCGKVRPIMLVADDPPGRVCSVCVRGGAGERARAGHRQGCGCSSCDPAAAVHNPGERGRQ